MSSNIEVWTEQRVASLRRLWAEKELSCSQIAVRIGGVSKNSVISKAKRLKLPMRTSGGPPGPRGPQRHPRRRVERRAPPKPRPSRAKPPQAKVRPRDIPPPGALMIPLMELEMRSCRWPFGDSNFRFCGLNNWNGNPYCEHHCRLSYLPVTSRAERDRQRQAARWAA